MLVELVVSKSFFISKKDNNAVIFFLVNIIMDIMQDMRVNTSTLILTYFLKHVSSAATTLTGFFDHHIPVCVLSFVATFHMHIGHVNVNVIFSRSCTFLSAHIGNFTDANSKCLELSL